MHILLLEPDDSLSLLLHRMLEARGFLAKLAKEVNTARECVQNGAFDLALFDLDLEDQAATELLRITRAARPQTAILVLTSTRMPELRVMAFDSGADDCVVKPFSVNELCARLEAILRRTRRLDHHLLKVADLELDRIERRVARCGRKIDLTQKEFALLEFLMRHPGVPVSRSVLVEQVWNLKFGTNTNVVDVYINYLRKKVDEEFDAPLIETVRGVGYRLSSTRPA